MKAASDTLTAVSLADLGRVRDVLRQRAQDAARLAAEQAARERAAQRAQRLFAETVGAVTRLPHHGLATLPRTPPAPEPRQRLLDEQAALKEALSDEVDIESLLLTDDGLSFRREGVGPDVVTRLRRGHWSIQAQIDLHGLRRDAARDALAAFVRTSAQRGHRCLRVVHGKGNGSPGRQPVLKSKVQRWLAQCNDVIAFAQASGPEGGAGALIVLLGSGGRPRKQAQPWATPAPKPATPA